MMLTKKILRQMDSGGLLTLLGQYETNLRLIKEELHEREIEFDSTVDL